MSKEKPTFDPGKLPSKQRIARQNEFEFELLEQGVTPDEIAKARLMVKKAKEIDEQCYEEVIRPFLEEYGVSREDELPGSAQGEIELRTAHWYRDHRGGVFNDEGEIADE